MPLPRYLRLRALAALCAFIAPALSAHAMKVGQNLPSVTDSTTLPVFGDAMKQARPWLTRAVGTTLPFDSGYGHYGANGTLSMRSDGYPTRVPFLGGGVQQFVHTVVPCYDNGDYRFSVQGTGTLKIKGPGVALTTFEIAGSRTFTLTAAGVRDPAGYQNGYQRNQPSSWNIEIHVSNQADPIRNIQVRRPGYHTADRHAFDTTFLARIGHYKTLRMMDWMETNDNPRTAYNTPTKSKEYYTQATRDGVSMLHILDLANTRNRDIWICVPHSMTNANIHAMAQEVAQRLNPGLLCYVEYSNEVWNRDFDQHHWVNNNVTGPNTPHRYGTKANEVFVAFKQKFDAAGKGSQLRRVLAGQAANTFHITQALITAGANTDMIAIAPYFGRTFDGSQPLPNPLPSLDQLAHESYSEMIITRDRVRAHRAIAVQHNKPLICYEGGQHYVGFKGAENNAALTERLLTFNRDARMRNLYRQQYLPMLKQEGVTLFMNFAYVSNWGKWGSWGSMEWHTQPISPNTGDAVKEWAIRDWITANP